jgi:hypothetical protein
MASRTSRATPNLAHPTRRRDRRILSPGTQAAEEKAKEHFDFV